jgi:hypothetical protein
MLFNNAMLSDITIRQIYNGETKDYSKWFLKAFTGDFKAGQNSFAIVGIH